MRRRVEKTPEQWRRELPPEVYRVARQHGTEPPFSGACAAAQGAGVYRCACCGEALFDAAHKYDSGIGWPSFWRPIDAQALQALTDHSHGMVRTEVLCAVCDAHLGHVFPDGPPPTGQRYCINSVCLTLAVDSPSG